MIAALGRGPLFDECRR